VAKVPGFAKAAGEARTLPTQFLDFARGLFSGWIERPQREHDLLTYGLSMHTKATYKLPEGWSVETPPQDTTLETPAFAFRSKAASDGTTLALERELSVLAPRVKKADYAAFREAVTKAQSAASQTWKVKRAPPPAPAPAPPAGPGEGK
jgi:hypothetical protein